MYQSSNAFAQLIQESSRTFKARLTVNETVITDGIVSIKFNGGSNLSDDFTIGSAVSQYVEITIAENETQFEDQEIFVEIGMEVSGTMEYVPMGYFTVEQIDSDEDQMEITAYDRMSKADVSCFLDLDDSTTTIAVLQGVSEECGVNIVTSGLASKTMTKPEGYTCREILSYVAQIYGGFAICNRDGQIEIRTYSDPSYEVGNDRYWESFTHNDFPYVLQKITCYTGTDDDGESISVTVGSGARELSFSNPFMTQTLLNAVWEDLENYTFMPGSVRFLGDPRIDPWDIITVYDRNSNSYKVPAMSLTMEFDGGLTTEVTASGKSETEQSSEFTGPQTIQMDRYYAELVLIDQALINKLDVDTANITYATITNLEAVNAHITNLEAEYGDFVNLTTDNFYATNAEIGLLQASIALIDEAIIGKLDVDTADITYAKIEDLEATNAYITNLEAIFGTFSDLTTTNFEAVNAYIEILNANYANIETLLAGNAGVGDLQTIYLTADNTVIDSALIRNAVIQNITANDIFAGNISTNEVTISSDDGSLLIEGNTMQFTDSNGTVRIQIGQDATGNFTFSLFDETGTGILIDSTGIKEGAIADGLIVNDMVSENANISGSKLDIESVFTAMNGSTEVLYSNRIWFDEEDQSLTQVYSQMSETISSVQTTVTSITTSIEGINVDIASLTSTVSSQEDTLNAQQTSLSVLQGNISAIISESELTEVSSASTMYSKLAALILEVDGLTLQFSDLSTSYDTLSGQYTSMSSQLATFEVSLEGLSSTVSDVQAELNNLYINYCTNGTFEENMDGWDSSLLESNWYIDTYNDKTCLHIDYVLSGSVEYNFSIPSGGKITVSASVAVTTRRRIYMRISEQGSSSYIESYSSYISPSDWTTIETTVELEAGNYTLSFSWALITALSYDIYITDVRISPESTADVLNAIASVASSITQTVEEIALEVVQSYVTEDVIDTVISQSEALISASLGEIELSVSNIGLSVSELETRVTIAESSIIQNADNIELMVKEADVTGNYLIGKINLSSTTATIEASHINLTGAVTITSLASDVTDQLDTVLTTADTALTTADTALTTADTANTTATTANNRATYHYGTCSTAAATAAKVVTLSGFTLYTGAIVTVYFTYANTATSPTLNVNSTGAASIRVLNTTISAAYYWSARDTVTFIYNGSYWIMAESSAKTNIANWCYNNNTTYIDGGSIYTKTVTAAQIDVENLFAEYITATNLHITGDSTFDGTLNGADGIFYGEIQADTIRISSGEDQVSEHFCHIVNDVWHDANYSATSQVETSSTPYRALSIRANNFVDSTVAHITLSDQGYIRMRADQFLFQNGSYDINGVLQTSGIWSKRFGFTFLSLNGTTGNNVTDCPEGYRPRSTIWKFVAILHISSSNWYPGWMGIYTDGGISIYTTQTYGASVVNCATSSFQIYGDVVFANT